MTQTEGNLYYGKNYGTVATTLSQYLNGKRKGKNEKTRMIIEALSNSAKAIFEERGLTKNHTEECTKFITDLEKFIQKGMETVNTKTQKDNSPVPHARKSRTEFSLDNCIMRIGLTDKLICKNIPLAIDVMLAQNALFATVVTSVMERLVDFLETGSGTIAFHFQKKEVMLEKQFWAILHLMTSDEKISLKELSQRLHTQAEFAKAGKERLAQVCTVSFFEQDSMSEIFIANHTKTYQYYLPACKNGTPSTISLR